MIQPVRQRRVDIDEIAERIDREEPARRVIEIFDGVLQLLEHVLLPLAVAGDVGDRPHRVFRLVLALAERANPHPEPAAMGSLGACNPHLLLLPLALAPRLEQAKHCFGDIRITNEDPLNGPHILGTCGARQREIGSIGIDHMAARVGDRQPVKGVVGDMAHDRIVGAAVGKTDDAGGECEQVEQPDHRQQRQDAQYIRLRLRPPDGHQRDRHRNQGDGH